MLENYFIARLSAKGKRSFHGAQASGKRLQTRFFNSFRGGVLTKNNWHSLSQEKVFRELKSGWEGLGPEEAQIRQKKFGLNQPIQIKSAQTWENFFAQFKSPLVYLLLVAVLLSLYLGELADALVIFIIIFVNALVSFFQEQKAEKSLQALKKLVLQKAEVIRAGKHLEILSEDLVLGDLVVLSEGSKVPADLYLLKSEQLKIDESTLTGESVPVHKKTGVLPSPIALADRTNIAYETTMVSSGRGLGMVIAIGKESEIGKIAQEISQTEEEVTPLHKKLAAFSQILLNATIFLAVVVLLAGLIRGIEFLEILKTAIAAAVAIIPEGLPAVLTITLAVGVYKMAQNNAIVRRLQAVETLGSITCIACDKTGTLTYNQMTAEAVVLADAKEIKISGQGYQPEGEFFQGKKKIKALNYPSIKKLLQIAVLCNNANLVEEKEQWQIQGDPTEGSLIVAGAKARLYKDELENLYPRLGEIPFSSERQFMATWQKKSSKENFIAVKGTIEKILSLCQFYLMDGRKVPLTEGVREEILQQVKFKALQAYRIIAFAYKESKKTAIKEENCQDLLYLGFICLDDPLRPDAQKALEKCQEAGLRAIMITGDYAITASAIGEKIGLKKESSLVYSGTDLETMSHSQFSQAVSSANIFARITPKMKLKIVKELQAQGQIVAVTGDGINDAPVLKRADVGVAMGQGGTDVARETADMVLGDNNFATITSAIEEGRMIFLNIRRAVFYLLSTNAGEIMILILALILGLPLPLTAIQILWINLITDSSGALALAMEPKHIRLAHHPPRSPKEGILTKENYQRILLIALLMSILTLAVFYGQIKQGASLYSARSTAFVLMAILQIFNILNCRSLRTSLSKMPFFSNKLIIYSIVISFILTIMTTQTVYFQQLFETVALNLSQWFFLIIISLSIIAVVEIDKYFTAKKIDKRVKQT